MVKLFGWVLTAAREIGGDRVAAAFEWPKGATGWQQPLVRSLVEHLPHQCLFDGCRYDGFVTTKGWLKKPWCIQTDVEALVQPLSLRCLADHGHVSLRGALAVKSGLYIAAMVEAVGKAATKSKKLLAAVEGGRTARSVQGNSPLRRGCRMDPFAGQPDDG